MSGVSPRVRPRSCAAKAWLLTTMLAGSALAGSQPPCVDASELAQGPYSSMHMTLQKTIFKINVAAIDVRFDKPAQSRFGALARGRGYSDAIAQQLAQVAIGAARALAQMQFMHDVSLDRWMGVVRDNLGQARAAGLIPRDLEQRVSQGLPGWFAPLRDRGYHRGDRLIYAITPEAVRTVVVSAGGQVLVDRSESDQGTRRVVLAGYFAPGSELREPLLRSLFALASP